MEVSLENDEFLHNLPPSFNSETQKSKKRTRNVFDWKSNARKRIKTEGMEYNKKKGGIAPAQPQRLEMCRCKCLFKLTPEDLEKEYQKFRDLKDHSLQNAYLQGRVEVSRVHHDRNGKNVKEFKYTVKLSTKTVQVCQKFWLGLYGIKRSRITHKVLDFDSSTRDGRGKHNHHYHIDDDFVERVKLFFRNLPTRKDHYSQQKNPSRSFIESQWTVPFLYNKFREENPDINDGDIKLSYFRFIFNTKFNIQNGTPRTDICNSCERLFKKYQVAQSQRPIDEIEVRRLLKALEDHHKEAGQFQQQIQSIQVIPDEWSLALDYKENIPLPLTRTQDEFFLSQLWINVFGIVHLETGQAHIFPYSEHFAAKGCNEVISCLGWYVQNVIPGNVKKLKIFMDNNFGQNKNQFVFGFLQDLTNTRFDKISVIFPIPGHSRMPIDSVFGIIGISQRRFEKITIPSQVVSTIRESQRVNPFQIVYVEHPLTDDLCDDGTPVVPVKDYKSSLSLLLRKEPGISTVREASFEKDTNPLFYSAPRFGGECKEFKLLKPTTTTMQLTESIRSAPDAYKYYKSIKITKLKNVRHLLECVILSDSCVFYESLSDKIEDQNNNSEQNNVPFKPMTWQSPYTLFVDSCLTRGGDMNIPFRLLAQLCAKLWKELTEQQKLLFVQKSTQDKQWWDDQGKRKSNLKLKQKKN